MKIHRSAFAAALLTMVCGLALLASPIAANAADDTSVQTRGADAASILIVSADAATSTLPIDAALLAKTRTVSGADACDSENTNPQTTPADAAWITEKKPYKLDNISDFLGHFNFAGNANDIAVNAVETCSYSKIGLSSTNRADSKSPIGLNYSRDAVANSSTATYVFAVGYVIAPNGSESLNIFTPFFGVDNESTLKAPQPGSSVALKYTAKSVYSGASYAHIFCIFDGKCDFAKANRAAIATVLDAYYLDNQMTHSRERVEDLHAFPVFKYVNKYDDCFLTGMACAWLAGAQVTTGQYDNIGSNPTLDRDYVRYGGRVGAAFRFPVMKDSISIQGTYQDFWASSGAHAKFGETNAQITYKPKDSLAGFAFTYTDGHDVSTGVRVSTWKIGITLTPQQ